MNGCPRVKITNQESHPCRPHALSTPCLDTATTKTLSFISKSGKHLQNKKGGRAHDMESFISNVINVPLDNGSGVYMNFGGRLYGGARQYSPGEMKARGEERWQESVMEVSGLIESAVFFKGTFCTLGYLYS